MTRVSKRVARRLFAEEKPFWIVPCNMVPYHGAIYLTQLRMREHKNFDTLVNAFEYYNCDHERGYYAAYYVED